MNDEININKQINFYSILNEIKLIYQYNYNSPVTLSISLSSPKNIIQKVRKAKRTLPGPIAQTVIVPAGISVFPASFITEVTSPLILAFDSNAKSYVSFFTFNRTFFIPVST